MPRKRRTAEWKAVQRELTIKQMAPPAVRERISKGIRESLPAKRIRKAAKLLSIKCGEVLRDKLIDDIELSENWAELRSVLSRMIEFRATSKPPGVPTKSEKTIDLVIVRTGAPALITPRIKASEAAEHRDVDEQSERPANINQAARRSITTFRGLFSGNRLRGPHTRSRPELKFDGTYIRRDFKGSLRFRKDLKKISLIPAYGKLRDTLAYAIAYRPPSKADQRKSLSAIREAAKLLRTSAALKDELRDADKLAKIKRWLLRFETQADFQLKKLPLKQGPGGAIYPDSYKGLKLTEFCALVIVVAHDIFNRKPPSAHSVTVQDCCEWLWRQSLMVAGGERHKLRHKLDSKNGRSPDASGWRGHLRTALDCQQTDDAYLAVLRAFGNDETSSHPDRCHEIDAMKKKYEQIILSEKDSKTP